MVKLLALSVQRIGSIAGRARTTSAAHHHQRHSPHQHAGGGRRGISAAALTKTLRGDESTIQQRCPPKQNLVFGTTLTDHMLQIEWEKGNWKAPGIVPYQDLQISPAASCLHYGAFFTFVI